MRRPWVSLSEANRSRVVNSHGIQVFTPSVYEVRWNRQDRSESESGGDLFGVSVCHVGENTPHPTQSFASGDIFAIDSLDIDDQEVSSRVWAHEAGGLEIDSQHRTPPVAVEKGTSCQLRLSWRQKLRIIYRARVNDKSQAVDPATNVRCLSTVGLQDQVAGMLGHPLGSPLSVRGKWKASGTDGRGLEVTEVNGKKLSTPIVWPSHMIRWHDFCAGAPADVVQVRLREVGTISELSGCEIIEYQGVPDGYDSYDRSQQTTVGLQSGFRIWKKVDSAR